MPNSNLNSRTLSLNTSGGNLIPRSLSARGKQSPNLMQGPIPAAGRPKLSRSLRSATSNDLSARSNSHISIPIPRSPTDRMNGMDSQVEIKELVKDAVKEYFDSLNLPQLMDSHGVGVGADGGIQDKIQPQFRGYDENGEQVWAVVHKDPMAELMNSTASRPSSRLLVNANNINSFAQSKEQFWKNDADFQHNLHNWASTAPDHEKEIVKNLLKRLNGGQTPADMKTNQFSSVTGGDKNRLRKSHSGLIRSERPFVPVQYQCDVSMFTKPPYNPQRHFTINPEWTSERYTVKKIPMAHLHPSASLKNELGLLRS